MTCDFVQFTVRVRDQSNPEKETTVAVQIVVSRDQFPPVIDFSNYTTSIDENEHVNKTAIVNIMARDRDLKVRPTTTGYCIPMFTVSLSCIFTHITSVTCHVWHHDLITYNNVLYIYNNNNNN